MLDRRRQRLAGVVGVVGVLASAACSEPRGAPGDPNANGDAGVESGAPADAGPPPPFTIAALVRAGIGSENSVGWPNVGKAYGDVDWKAGPFASVALIVDLESSCYPFDGWTADPPPPGQNWPPHCDAFDRNFNVFLDDPGAPPPAFELAHAITPFGGPERLQVDLTDLANALPGPHRLRVDITSYSDAEGKVTGSNAGWTVSARVEVTPGVAPRRVLAAIPLFAGQVGAGDPWPVVPFQVPAGTQGGRLEYRTSGHGQGAKGPRCIGPAEEFCDRRHHVIIDGVEAQNVGAFREDCASLCTLTHYGPAAAGFDYCLENPGGLPDSVRASRANWCPGSMTPPWSWTDIPALAVAGPHTFSFQVSQIASGGFWLASAIYYAFGP
jgi:hypothetical protein